jgi:hypothetical protein
MPHICYTPKKFTPAHVEIIEKAEAICEEYMAAGLNLTLRQTFYQFVARGWLPNKQSEYKRLGDILNDARMAGQLDWDFLIDRTRNLADQPHWDSPADLVKGAANQFRPDLWAGQHKRVEVWVEKDAAIGVIERVCQENDVPFFSCRGYTSVSEMWAAGQRLRWHIEEGDQVTVLHIGDHDPSGLDMSRDIEDRLRTFIHGDWLGLHPVVSTRRGVTRGQIRESMREVMRSKGSKISDDGLPWRIKRIALNQDQVERYSPPPNPAKTTDSRFQKYVEQTGLDESWELDALDPFVLQSLIQEEIDMIRDEDTWSAANQTMEEGRATLKAVADNWDRIAEIHRPKGLS